MEGSTIKILCRIVKKYSRTTLSPKVWVVTLTSQEYGQNLVIAQINDCFDPYKNGG